MGSSSSKPREDEAERDARLRPLLEGDEEMRGRQRDVRDDAAATTHPPATTEDAAREVVAMGVEITSPPLEEGTQSKVEKVEDAEAESDEGSDVREVGIRELRWAWILFQCAWLAIFVALGDEWTLPSLLWLTACLAKGSIVEEFRPVDFFPLVAWEALFCLDSDILDALGAMLLLVSMLFLLMAPILCCCVYTPSTVHQRVIIALSGRFDAFERLLEKIMDPIPYINEGEGEEERTEDVVAIEILDRLEDLSKKGQLKKPHWVLAVLVVLGAWQVAFLYYMHHSVILLNDVPKSIAKPKNIPISPTPRGHGLKRH